MNIPEPSVGKIARAFLHLGLTAFGGLAMVEPMRKMTVDKQGWLWQADFLDGLALCQLLPGATVVQLGTYVGYRLRRVPGALMAAAAFILPAFILMLVLSVLYFKYADISWVQAISRGMGAVVIALLLQALWRLSQAVRKHWLDAVIALLALGAFWLRVNFLLVFLVAGLLRMALGLWFVAGHDSQNPALTTTKPRLGSTLAMVALALLGVGLMVWTLGRLQPDLGRMAQIFLKIGVVSFGGGYAMIPILQWDVVNAWHWLTLKQFLDGILLGFITPGPIIILATFVGYKVYGLYRGQCCHDCHIPPADPARHLFDPILPAGEGNPVDAPGNSRHPGSFGGHAGPGDPADGPGNPYRPAGFTLNRGDGHRADRF